jgi:hypothetical protein
MRCVTTLKSTDGVGTGVSVGVSTGVGVGAGGGVFAGTGVSVGVGTGVSVGSGVSVGFSVGVGTGVLVAVLVGIGVLVRVLVAVAVAGGRGVLVGVGVIRAMTWQLVRARARKTYKITLEVHRSVWSKSFIRSFHLLFLDSFVTHHVFTASISLLTPIGIRSPAAPLPTASIPTRF